MNDPLRDSLTEIVAETVRAEMKAANDKLLPALIAAIQATPPQKKRLTIREARRLLPGGVRVGRMLAALKSGALRGEQRANDQRRTWIVEVDDLFKWDAAGRPETRP
jgi:hypothetical protein